MRPSVVLLMGSTIAAASEQDATMVCLVVLCMYLYGRNLCIATCDHLHFCQVIVRGLSRASSPLVLNGGCVSLFSLAQPYPQRSGKNRLALFL